MRVGIHRNHTSRMQERLCMTAGGTVRPGLPRTVMVYTCHSDYQQPLSFAKSILVRVKIIWLPWRKYLHLTVQVRKVSHRTVLWLGWSQSYEVTRIRMQKHLSLIQESPCYTEWTPQEQDRGDRAAGSGEQQYPWNTKSMGGRYSPSQWDFMGQWLKAESVRDPCLRTLLLFSLCPLVTSCPPPLWYGTDYGGNKEFCFGHTEFGKPFQHLRGDASLGVSTERVGLKLRPLVRRARRGFHGIEQGPEGGRTVRRGKSLRALNNLL